MYQTAGVVCCLKQQILCSWLLKKLSATSTNNNMQVMWTNKLARVPIYPSEDGEEAEGNGSLHVVDTNAPGRCLAPAPLVGKVTEPNEVQQSPEACRSN